MEDRYNIKTWGPKGQISCNLPLYDNNKKPLNAVYPDCKAATIY